MISERTQKKLFDKIASQYEVQYNEKYSQQYHQNFIIKSMFEGIELSGTKVIEGMCGSGHDQP
jgi:ubiquinone/menaquinone biosynthesis C-methylase UbiE|tara:strand:- start:35 stop:223 length:189 start_codon:yes stop_codon:yes gene_type:complete